jgi:hypothetical protein
MNRLLYLLLRFFIFTVHLFRFYCLFSSAFIIFTLHLLHIFTAFVIFTAFIISIVYVGIDTTLHALLCQT